MSGNKAFCVIFPGFELRSIKISQIDFEKYTDEEIQKFLLEALPIKNEFFEESKKRDAFTDIVTKYLTKLLNGEHPYSIFDNFINVFQKVLEN